MKKFLYLAIVGTIIWSCGGGSDDPTPVPPVVENESPSIPTTIYPANNDLCIDNTVNFQWNASTDSDGDAITYTVEISDNNSFSPISQTKTTSATSISVSLDKGVAFYWRVRAKDSEDSSGNSSENSFYTEGDGVSNHIPFAPVLVAPELNTVVQTATTNLEWTASDIDTEDTLTYDVYFGTDAEPTTKIGDNITATTLEVTVTNNPNYYWKVVVKDGNGGETIGQVWNFKVD